MSTLTRITLGRLQVPSGAGQTVLAGFVGAAVEGVTLQASASDGLKAGFADAGMRAIVAAELAASVGSAALSAGLAGAIVAEVD